jgi:hypothetical protein
MSHFRDRDISFTIETKTYDVSLSKNGTRLRYELNLSPFITMGGLVNLIRNYNMEYYEKEMSKFNVYINWNSISTDDDFFCKRVMLADMDIKEITIVSMEDEFPFLPCVRTKSSTINNKKDIKYNDELILSAHKEKNGTQLHSRFKLYAQMPWFRNKPFPLIYKRRQFSPDQIIHEYGEDIDYEGREKLTKKEAIQYFNNKIEKMATNYEDPHFSYCNVCYNRNICYRIDRDVKLEKRNYITTLCCDLCKDHVIKHIGEKVCVYYYI